MAVPAAPTNAWSPTSIAAGFVAGALSVLVFQMGLGALLHGLGITPNTPYSMAPTSPLGVPQTLSAAFWGGLWGILLQAILLRVRPGPAYWAAAAALGGFLVGGTLLLVVFPLKGRPFAAGWSPETWLLILCLHATFGLGTAVFLRVIERMGWR